MERLCFQMTDRCMLIINSCNTVLNELICSYGRILLLFSFYNLSRKQSKLEINFLISVKVDP